MFHETPPPFALVSEPTEDLLQSLHVAAFGDRWPPDTCAELAEAAWAAGADPNPPPPVKDSPLVLLAHAWSRSPLYRKELAPLVGPLSAGSHPLVRERALGVLIHSQRRRTGFMDQLLALGARAQDWMLQSLAISLHDLSDSAARTQLRLYAACGWSPSGAAQEEPTLLAIIKALRPGVLEEWVQQHAGVGKMLPADPNGNGADLLEVVLARRKLADNQREVQKCDAMILILAQSGLLPPRFRDAGLEPWITEALVEGETTRLERQTPQPAVFQSPRMRL